MHSKKIQIRNKGEKIPLGAFKAFLMKLIVVTKDKFKKFAFEKKRERRSKMMKSILVEEKEEKLIFLQKLSMKPE